MNQSVMKRTVGLLVVLSMLVIPGLPVQGGVANFAARAQSMPDELELSIPIYYYADEIPSDFRVPPPAEFLEAGGNGLNSNQTATITVNYLPEGSSVFSTPCYTWPAGAKVPFDYAASVWSTLITSSVPIVIDACWASLSGGILGASGATGYYKNFPSAPQADTYYQVSLANAISGTDRNGSTAEMRIMYNQNFSWYYGTDGNTPAGQHDFVSVVMHEIAHGLNFAGSMTYGGGLGYWGWGSEPEPSIYDRFTQNSGGATLLSLGNGTSALGSALTGGQVYFNGTNANAANGGSRPKLYAPSTWSSGSSYAHLDEVFNGTPNALMTYSIGSGESIHNPGPIVLGMLKDLGWPSGGTPTNTAPTIAGLPDKVVPMNSSLNNAIDLWAYASDAQSTDAQLTFSISNTPNANAGVSIASNRYVNINPVAGWTGETDVTIRVADPGGLSATDTFHVSVVQVKVWNGSVNTNWHEPNNWTPAGVPTQLDNTTIPNVTNDPIISSGNAEVKNLTINSGAVLDLRGSLLTVDGVLSNQGTLKQDLDVAEGSTVNFLRITNKAGTQTAYYGLDITPVTTNALEVEEDGVEEEGMVPFSREELANRPAVTLNSPNNTPPTISGIPDVNLAVNESVNNIIDLWEWANDAESSGFELTYTIDNTPDPNAGVMIDSLDFVDINPAAGWSGWTDVTIRVTDPGGLSDTDTFRVTVGSGANTPPTLTGIPDKFMPANSSLDNAIDLWAYASDNESADNLLTFSIANTPAAGAGVSIDSNRYIDITPAANWTGKTDVSIRVTDPDGLSAVDAFQVAVGKVTHVSVSVSGNQYCSGRSRGVKRCFDIHPAAALNATVRFYFTEAERNGETLSKLLVYYDKSGWKDATGTYTRGGTGNSQYVQITGVSDYSHFALSSPSGPVYLSMMLRKEKLQPKAGKWLGNGVELYVNPTSTAVDDFAIYVNVTGCGTYKITHLPLEPITSNSFSFTGPFYANGTFAAPSFTTAGGLTGLSSFSITGCGRVTGGPFNWNASWNSASQPYSLEVDSPLMWLMELVPFDELFYTVTQID